MTLVPYTTESPTLEESELDYESYFLVTVTVERVTKLAGEYILHCLDADNIIPNPHDKFYMSGRLHQVDDPNLLRGKILECIVYRNIRGRIKVLEIVDMNMEENWS